MAKIDLKKIENFLDGVFVERQCELWKIDPTMNGLEYSLGLLFVDVLCYMSHFIKEDRGADPKGYKAFFDSLSTERLSDKNLSARDLYYYLLEEFVSKEHLELYTRTIQCHLEGKFSDYENVWNRCDTLEDYKKVLDSME